MFGFHDDPVPLSPREGPSEKGLEHGHPGLDWPLEKVERDVRQKSRSQRIREVHANLSAIAKKLSSRREELLAPNIRRKVGGTWKLRHHNRAIGATERKFHVLRGRWPSNAREMDGDDLVQRERP